jgi:hypothetical protein
MNRSNGIRLVMHAGILPSGITYLPLASKGPQITVSAAARAYLSSSPAGANLETRTAKADGFRSSISAFSLLATAARTK